MGTEKPGPDECMLRIGQCAPSLNVRNDFGVAGNAYSRSDHA